MNKNNKNYNKKKVQDAEYFEEDEGPEALGEEVGKRGSKRGSESLEVEAALGEGCRKKPFSLIALSSAKESKEEPFLAAEEEEEEPDRLNGSGISGVTGLRTREGKSRILGDKISCLLRGEKVEFEKMGGNKGLMLRFL
ncbi:hypothetical protein MtrunA17_Chr2g0282371 [Medicago truncatula]|uniref:Uncharacterized protein n=1 Tax=Medicago truncatula TaxID=3880 RepID=A0A396J1R2_MEDTR|nr:hypothetical protein MtrunA17_Chr2g0282371 [Medicago truncatula]